MQENKEKEIIELEEEKPKEIDEVITEIEEIIMEIDEIITEEEKEIIELKKEIYPEKIDFFTTLTELLFSLTTIIFIFIVDINQDALLFPLFNIFLIITTILYLYNCYLKYQNYKINKRD